MLTITKTISVLAAFTMFGANQFSTSGVVADLTVPADQLSFNQPTVCTLACGGLTDVYGVRVFALNGHIYQHPVGQAQLALRLLNSYRLNGSALYLHRAILNAQRLVDDRVKSGGAWFYPYRFNFAVYGDQTHLLPAPWYSGMAQTQALSLFVRLFDITNNPAWKTAAAATFASLLVRPSFYAPWVTWVDASGYLWLEEYPRWPVQTSERVLNGSIFAAFGVYDYFRLTGNSDAATMFDGQVTTIEHYLPTWRVTGGSAYYSLEHKIQDVHYQPIVTEELRCLYKLTGRHIEAFYAWALYQDYHSSTRLLLCGTTA